MPKIVYSDSATNPSLTLTVYEYAIGTNLTIYNPLTYSSVGNILTVNCYKANGFRLEDFVYYFFIDLSEDGGSAS
jgi:hypothetical protein